MCQTMCWELGNSGDQRKHGHHGADNGPKKLWCSEIFQLAGKITSNKYVSLYYGLNCVPTPHHHQIHIRALTLNVTVFRNGAFKGVIEIK